MDFKDYLVEEEKQLSTTTPLIVIFVKDGNNNELYSVVNVTKEQVESIISEYDYYSILSLKQALKFANSEKIRVKLFDLKLLKKHVESENK
jgi:exopolysaccharide biosynthesis predicted pyruvyltransferase EpsI